jgi:hypothetical protein
MSTVGTGEDAMRGLMGTAFTAGEPALPDVDEVMATVAVLGDRIRHRQRVRTGVAAGALCVAAFGMVAGIAAVAHSTHSGGTSVVVPGGSGGPMPPVSGTTAADGNGGSAKLNANP